MKIQNKYVFCKAFYEIGFHIVHDLFDTHGEFLSYERIYENKWAFILNLQLDFNWKTGLFKS